MCSNIVFATNSCTKCHISCSLSSIAEFRQTANVAEHRSIEFIPSSTWVVHVCFTIFHFDSISTSCLVSSRSCCFHCSSLHRDFLFCDKSDIQLVEFSCCKIAIIHHFIDAHTCRDSKESRQSHFERTSQRHHHTHPSKTIRLVSQRKFHLLFILFHRSDIKVEPLSIAWHNHSACFPIEFTSIVATKAETIVDINTERNCFVCSHLEIHLFHIAIECFVEHITHKARWEHCKVSPSWHSDRSEAKCSVIAIYCSSQRDICSFFTVIDKCNIWDERQRVEQLICHAIPFSSTSCLFIFHTTSNSHRLVTICRVNNCRDSLSCQFYFCCLKCIQVCWNQRHNVLFRTDRRKFFDRSSCSRDYCCRHIEVFWVWQQGEHVVVDYLTKSFTWLHWQDIRDSIITCTSTQDFTHHNHHFIALISECKL